jgi:hypothetical protein
MLEPKADEPSLTYCGTGGCIGAYGSPVHHHEIGTFYREALVVRGWQVEPPWPSYWVLDEDVLREHGLFEEVTSALDVAPEELPLVGVPARDEQLRAAGLTWICSARSRRCRRRVPGEGSPWRSHLRRSISRNDIWPDGRASVEVRVGSRR